MAGAKRDLAGARYYYEKCLAIAEELREKTGTIESMRDLSICYERLGDTLKARGDLQAAEDFYEKDLAIAEQLAKNTGTIKAYRDLAIILFNFGVFLYNNSEHKRFGIFRYTDKEKMKRAKKFLNNHF